MEKQDTSIIFIAVDKESYTFINRLRGQCLLYEKPVSQQSLSFFYEKEVWVLYALSKYFERAMQLGRHLQLAGSHKVIVIYLKR